MGVIGCSPSRITTVSHFNSSSVIEDITILHDMGTGLGEFTDDFILETKSQLQMNGIENNFKNFDSGSFNLSEFDEHLNDTSFVLLIREKNEERTPFVFDLGTTTGWTWFGSIFGRTYSFDLTLYNPNKEIVWTSEIHSSADKFVGMKIMGKEFSRDFLKEMEKKSFLPTRFKFVQYTLKSDD